MRVPIGFLGGGIWGRVQVGGGGWVCCGKGGKGKGDGEGEGVGVGTCLGKSNRTHLSKLPFRKLPFNFSPIV